MASPVGHVLTGYAIGRIGQGREDRLAPLLWLGGAVMAAAPDLDFLPGLLVGRPATFHQAASHSFAFAFLVSGVGAVALVRDRRVLPRAWAVFFLAYVSHLLLDYFGPDLRPPIGIPLFWPFSDATYLSSATLLPGIQHAASTSTDTLSWLASVFSGYNLKAIGIEIAVVGPWVLIAELRHRRRRSGRNEATRRTI